jgi:hypothetical protein
MSDSNDQFFIVVKTPDSGIIAVAKSILEGAGIEYYAENEMPLIAPYAIEGVRGIELKVSIENAEKACQLLKDLPGARSINDSQVPATPLWIPALVLLGFVLLAVILSLLHNGTGYLP